MAQAFLVESLAPEKHKHGEMVVFGLALDATLQQAQALVDAKCGPGCYRVTQPPSGAIFAVQRVEAREIADACLDSGDDAPDDMSVEIAG